MIHRWQVYGCRGALAAGCLLGLNALLAGCGGASMGDASEATQVPYPEDPSSGGDDDDGDDGEPTLPPETGDAYYRAAPAATDLFVFVVNPDRDTVSKINATTRAVYTLPVGIHPTQVLVGAANPNKALVLNEGSASLSIVDARTDAVQEVSIHKDTNFMGVSADGQYAITWYNPQVEGASDDIDGVRSYSNICLLYTSPSPRD